ncbi:MAG: glycine zipper family protein [Sphingobacteriales bacterium]|nr:MAG: glycine zipper family protein [Sphingobacteriales bacterium]
MKRLFIIAGISLSLGACHNDVKEAQQRSIDSMQNELAKQHIVDSMNQASAEAEAVRRDSIMTAQQQAVASSNSNSTRRSGSGSSRRSSGSASNSYYTTNNYANPAPAATQPQQATPQQKKRWSSKATGTLIGAGAGALGGALISDQKGKGAIIGGLGGAAVGLGTGAIIDAERKKKEERQQQQQQ